MTLNMIYEGTYTGNKAIDKQFSSCGFIPILGFGTGTDYKDRSNDASKNMILAFKAGYRLFDTAQVGAFRKYVFTSIQ